jgi:prepilin peptidase CpaA
MFDLILMTLFPFLVMAAAIADFFTMKIPNRLNLAIAGLMLPVALMAGMPGDVFLWHLAAGALMLAAGFGLFAANAIGGGDAKLFAAASLWIGWSQLMPFAIYTALAGGALAIIMKTWQLVRIEHEVKDVAWLKQVIRTNLDLPYGVAIATGALLAYPATFWMKQLV